MLRQEQVATCARNAIAYKPENLIKTLEIFRVYYNYCKVGEDKKTPAMRLGLAEAPIKPEDILYYKAT